MGDVISFEKEITVSELKELLSDIAINDLDDGPDLDGHPCMIAIRFIDRDYQEALTLANAVYAKFYRDDAPDWKPLDYTSGLISQIDNMVAGLTKGKIDAKS